MERSFRFHRASHRHFCLRFSHHHGTVALMYEKVPLEPVPGRKTPAQGVKISSEDPTRVFLTVNAKDRIPWISQQAVHASLETVWRKAETWLVGYYVLMPDHLHLICAPRNLQFTIEDWMKFWKSQFSRIHLDKDWDWQRKGFHHRLRNEEELINKLYYMRENPVRKGLAQNADDWPFQGTIHDLRW